MRKLILISILLVGCAENPTDVIKEHPNQKKIDSLQIELDSLKERRDSLIKARDERY